MIRATVETTGSRSSIRSTPGTTCTSTDEPTPAHGVSEKSNQCRVSRDAPVVLDDGSRATVNCFQQILSSLVTVDSKANLIAGFQVRLGRRTDSVPLDFQAKRWALHDRKRLARVEPQLGVERQRTIMVSRLNQPDTGKALFPGPF